MQKYTLVVLSNPTEYSDEELNRWYNDQHMGDVLRIPGMIAGQRFEVAGAVPGRDRPGWRYLALFEFEADEPADVLSEINNRMGTPVMVMSDALDFSTILAFPVTAITGRLPASGGGGRARD